MIQPAETSTRGGLIKMEIETDPRINAEHTALLSRFDRNVRWYLERAEEIERQNAGHYICVSGEELFVDTALSDVLSKARARHPQDDAPFVKYVPKERKVVLGGAGLRLSLRPRVATSPPEFVEEAGNAG